MKIRLIRFITYFLFIFNMATYSLAEMSLSEKITLSTVRIETTLSDGSRMSGTGFFFNFMQEAEGRHIPAIVTNKHVINGAVKGLVYLNRADANGECILGSFEPIVLQDGEKGWLPHPSPDVDLAVLPIGPFLNQQAALGKRYFYIALDVSLVPSKQDEEGFTAIEDIVMIGYPNGIWDDKNNRPISRRGITATHPSIDYAAKSEFLIDAACFPGSSGSPVFLFNQGSYPTKAGGIILGNRLKLLGVLFAGPQHVAVGEVKIVPIANPTRTVAVSSIPNNLGIVIKAKRLLEF